MSLALVCLIGSVATLARGKEGVRSATPRSDSEAEMRSLKGFDILAGTFLSDLSNSVSKGQAVEGEHETEKKSLNILTVPIREIVLTMEPDGMAHASASKWGDAEEEGFGPLIKDVGHYYDAHRALPPTFIRTLKKVRSLQSATTTEILFEESFMDNVNVLLMVQAIHTQQMKEANSFLDAIQDESLKQDAAEFRRRGGKPVYRPKDLNQKFSEAWLNAEKWKGKFVELTGTVVTESGLDKTEEGRLYTIVVLGQWSSKEQWRLPDMPPGVGPPQELMPMYRGAYKEPSELSRAMEDPDAKFVLVNIPARLVKGEIGGIRKGSYLTIKGKLLKTTKLRLSNVFGNREASQKAIAIEATEVQR